MGWTVLYIAFGVVALWLLGEVLLQYKARLRWRLLAFGGFLGVVLGVLIPSVVVIGLGAIAFAIGQTCVTLSFRRGFSTGWAIGGRPGASRRRKDGDEEEGREPALQVSGLEETGVLSYDPPAVDDFGSASFGPEPVYEPQPMPDDTNGYGVYTGPGPDPEAAPAPDQGGQGDGYGAYDPYYGDQPQHQPPGQDEFAAGQQQYAAYSDPYVGGQQYNAFESYDSFGNPQQYGSDAYYPQQSYTDTPPGGVWVPQQRDTEQQDQPAPQGYGPEHDEGQYRY
ncbi:hypothetical protein GCM10010387_55310 [Streptomyces inusitatus]|uniref:Uncharacterized protein n=1 Tax=Streptomyces inusitatus TaxID=68221 RepID=A0A918QLD3_9ACTN|nr:hypothetical protein [Streptomyces inusitatus]GGZ54192.1 hypothetical protein GCM10010387_55310 [Streptomyces inusitatus]